MVRILNTQTTQTLLKTEPKVACRAKTHKVQKLFIYIIRSRLIYLKRTKQTMTTLPFKTFASLRHIETLICGFTLTLVFWLWYKSTRDNVFEPATKIYFFLGLTTASNLNCENFEILKKRLCYWCCVKTIGFCR